MDKSIEPANDLAHVLERAKSFPSSPELRTVNNEHPLPDPMDDEYSVFRHSKFVKYRRYGGPSSDQLEDEYSDEGHLYALDAYEYLDEHDLLDDCDDARTLYRGPGN